MGRACHLRPQDAFQATFLVLVRQAGAIRRRDSVASWLYGVARRLARGARAHAARRRMHERRSVERGEESGLDSDQLECWAALHEEIARLPEKYRAAVVLCYCEGLTTDAAARRLGCPQGTVLSRLSRAREQLRGCLTRRGLAVPAWLLAVDWAPSGAAAAVPAALGEATTRAALQFLAGQVSAGAVPAAVAALTGTMMRTMLMTKIKKTAAALLTLSVLSVGAWGLARQEPGPDDGGNAPGSVPGATQASQTDAEQLQGTWVMITQETDGGEVPPIKDIKLVVTGKMMMESFPEGYRGEPEQDRQNGLDKCSYTIDPSKEPRRIDFVPVAGTQKGKLRPGIYRLDGNTLQIAFSPDGSLRPTEFNTKLGSHHRLMIFRRDLPFTTIPAPAPARTAQSQPTNTPVLEFRIVAETKHDHAAVEKAKAPDGLKNPPQGYRWVGVDERFRLDLREGDIVREEAQSDGKLRKHLLVKLDPFNLTEKDIALVTEIKDERQFPAIGLRFKPDGAQRFGELTRAHLPEEMGLFKCKLAIIIDGVAVSDPMINSIIREGAMIEMGNQIQPEEFTELIKRISRGGGNRGVEKGSP